MKRLALVMSLTAALAASAACAPRSTVRIDGGIPAAIASRGALDTSPLVLPAMREETLPNGLTLIALEDHELPAVSIALFWPTGDTSDPPGLDGLSSIASALLRQGTTTRGAEEIAQAIESVGGELSSGSEMEWTSLQARVLSRDLDVALDLIADIAQHPSFPAGELEDVRRSFIGSAMSGLDDPNTLAGRFATARVYGAEHPYAVDLTASSLRKIRREDVVAHAARVYGPSGAILAIGGDVDPIAVLADLRARFAGWKGPATAAARPEFPPMPPAKRQVVLVDKPGLTQTFMRVGLPAFERRHPDFAAAILTNNVLGGSYSSRLTKVVRADGGKTYGVDSWFSVRHDAGAFWVSTSTRTEETVATLDLVLREIAKMRDGGVSRSELANAKSNRAGSHVRNFETSADVLSQVVSARLLEVPISEVTDWRRIIAETPVEQVNAAAKKWLDVENARIVVVGDAEAVRPLLEKAYGPVEVVDFRADPAGGSTR